MKVSEVIREGVEGLVQHEDLDCYSVSHEKTLESFGQRHDMLYR